MFFVSFGGSYS